jgi:membrane fusion protein (multidrug efflux system)
MAIRLTRRGLIVALVVLGIVGAVGATMAVRGSKKGGDAAPPGAAPAAVTLEFTGADVAHVESLPLSRWLPVSGTLQPLNQATVKAKVSGDVRQITVREGETVQAGQVLARIDTADLEAKLAASIGALESAKAQLALAAKTRATNQALLKQNFISQNAFDNSESSFSVSQGTVKSAEAQAQLARNALRDAVATSPLTGIVAKRHVQPGEKVAFDSPLVTIVDLNALELQAMVPAVDVPELTKGMKVELTIDGFGEQRFSGKIERINPSTEPGTRAFLVYVGIPNAQGVLRGGMFATGRVGIAAQAPSPTLPIAAIRMDAGQAYVWAIESGKLVRRNVALGRRDENTGRVELKTPLPADLPILASKFDNLKEGAPALVKAESTNPAKPA